MANVASLSQLPVELINGICTHIIEGRPGSYACKLYGVYAFRLTCRTLYSKTFRDFCKAAYSTLIVDLTVGSLDRLYAISQHPEISKTVRCIYLAHDSTVKVYLGLADRRPDNPLKEQLPVLLREGFKRTFVQLSNLKALVIPAPFTAVFRRGWQKDVDQETLSVSASSDDRELLSETFIVEQSCISLKTLFPLLTDAMTGAGTKLTKLEVPTIANDRPNRLWINSPQAIGICTASLTHQQKVWEDLRHMQISLIICHLNCVLEDGSSDACAVDQETDLPRTLAMMPKLTSLYLTCLGKITLRQNRRRSRIIARSLSLVRLPCLKTIKMTRCKFEEVTLRNFYSNHSQTLQHLRLEVITMLEGTWHSFLTWLSRNHTHKLSMVYLISMLDSREMAHFLFEDSLQRQYSFALQSPMLSEQLDRVALIAKRVQR